MSDIEFLYIGFVIIAGVVGGILYHLDKLDKLFYKWKMHMTYHDKRLTDVSWHRADDLGKLAALEQRVRALEEKLDAKLEDSKEPELPDPEDDVIPPVEVESERTPICKFVKGW